ncbi:MAG: Aspartyl/glutamyl-tRNA(Asn/Gln) amidotransferase subunit B [Parcubacteria group bacterium GW2011_GWA2_51_10]|nr:MAG: Aspartyl/glutamyl-tRNA(Asn/Gln) amidotransferase subunit B [Parcubacteria group bacterium GW2011_GWA2_51_10]
MTTNYIPTIGLEIHAELRTKTKMFCNSKNDPDESRPNINICPVCLAHPGTLPVINGEAIKHVLRVGIALRGTLADYTEFDRKNYFYPDLPKGYQISQWQHPLVSGGELAGISITRVHLEEDTASSIHGSTELTTGSSTSLTMGDDGGKTVIDFNRAGVPLMELVTEPVIKSAEEAGLFARELQLLLRYLGASEANMEKGEMRVEANVSVAPATEPFASADKRRMNAEGRRKNIKIDELILRNSASGLRNSAVPLGTKVEIKNLNSFRIMEKAVAYEIERQIKILESGGKVLQETRGWDDRIQKTFPQRTKEGSADYRYFPDPDLPSLRLFEMSQYDAGMLASELPELPDARRRRYVALGIKEADASQFVREPLLADYFEKVVEPYTQGSLQIVLSANYIANDLVNFIRLNEHSDRESRDTGKRDTEFRSEIPLSPQHFREIINMLASKEISSRSAKDLLALAIVDNKSPRALAESHMLLQTGDAAGLEMAVGAILTANPRVVADYLEGKSAALDFLVGAVMKSLRGAADPTAIRDALQKAISISREGSSG